MAIDYTYIGKRIKQYRSEKDMSQEKLASLIGTVSKHISHIETGNKVPSLEMLINIANALDVSADDLLTDSLNHSSSPVSTEIHDLLLDCNRDEKTILTETVRFLKALLVRNGI